MRVVESEAVASRWGLASVSVSLPLSLMVAACGPQRSTTTPRRHVRATMVPAPVSIPPAPPLAAGEAAPVHRAAAGVLRGLMIEGALRIEPDAALAAAIDARGREVFAIVTVCLDEDGTPTGELRRRSRLPAFDRAALAVVKTWRFRPYLDGGVAAPVCSEATFVQRPSRPPGDRPWPDDVGDALPDPLVELPESRLVAVKLAPDQTAVPPTPGVAIARVCRTPGARTAPGVMPLQSSGDPDVDRSLFTRRVTAPVDEPAADEPDCSVVAAIASPSRTPAPADDEDADDDPPDVVHVAVEAKRISGSKNIYPSDAVKTAIQQRGIGGFDVAVKVCVGVDGKVSDVRLLKPSGFVGYDVDLINGIAAWRYEPFMIDGIPAPSCGLVNFAYRQT